MENKTLIAYDSKGGAIKQASAIIAEVLRDRRRFKVDLVDLRKTTPKLEEYHNVVVGAWVRGEKVYKEALKFLKRDFGERKVAFFVCCVVALLSVIGVSQSSSVKVVVVTVSTVVVEEAEREKN